MAFANQIPGRVAWTINPLRDAQLLSDFWSDLGRVQKRLAAEPRRTFVPHINVSESDDAYRVEAELPGLEAGDFEVIAEDDVLTLKGEKKRSEDSTGEGLRRSESVYGSFVRRLRFPEAIAEEGLTASFKNGVLVVTLPKPEEARAQVRSIPVQTA